MYIYDSIFMLSTITWSYRLPSIDWIGFINETGYGQAAYDYIRALKSSNNYDIKITCINGRPSSNFIESDELRFFHDACKKKSLSNQIQIFHCIPTIQMRYNRNARAMGFATFETFEPPTNWIGLLNKMDAVICPSLFNYKIFAHAGINKPIFHLPHCFDVNRFHDAVPPICKREKFTFLYFGTWKKRKGWPQLLEAYLEAFTEKDNVELLIKTDKINIAIHDIDKIKRNYNNRKDLPPISIERRIFDDAHIPSFYKSCDCLVMPTLGEGFGLPALQCMACKVPVVITNFSGCQDYANDDTCTLLEPSGFLLHSNMDQIIQFSNKKWPLITINTIKLAMRQVFENYEVAKRKAQVAYDFVHKNFNYNVINLQFKDIMESVYRVN